MTKEKLIDPCKKCGHKLLTCSTFVSDWNADQEPYIANEHEYHEGIYENLYINAQYCEKCETFDWIDFESEVDVLQKDTLENKAKALDQLEEWLVKHSRQSNFTNQAANVLSQLREFKELNELEAQDETK